MLKTIGRILIILLVVGLVAGGIYWFVQANPSLLGKQVGAHDAFGDQLRQPGSKNLPGDDDGLRPHRGFDGGGDHLRISEGLNVRSLSGILQNLLIIALTTIAVLAIQKIISLIRRQRQAKAAQQAEG